MACKAGCVGSKEQSEEEYEEDNLSDMVRNQTFMTLEYKYLYKDTWVQATSYFYDKLAYLMRKILHPYFYNIGIKISFQRYMGARGIIFL